MFKNIEELKEFIIWCNENDVDYFAIHGVECTMRREETHSIPTSKSVKEVSVSVKELIDANEEMESLDISKDLSEISEYESEDEELLYWSSSNSTNNE